MAVALHQRTGYPIHAVLHRIPEEEDAAAIARAPHYALYDYAELAHAFVVVDGMALDANGLAPLSEMGELGMVWEEGIGKDKHPETGRQGQWWASSVEPLTVERLCEIREACNDPLDPELLAEANAWIESRNLLEFLEILPDSG